MAPSSAFFYLVTFLFLGSARASISGGHCSDVSFYDHIRYHTEKADCCAGGNNQLRCEEKEEEVCVDVTEMICDVNAYADCQVEESAGGGGQCEGGYKNFEMRDCVEREFKEVHIKKVPVCKNVTKNNCVTEWEFDGNGNKVWTGLENCSPVTWEECSIEDKEVDFPTVKTDCGVVSQIKYFDYSPLPGSGSKVSTNCSPRGSVSCRPVTRTDCVKVSYTDCSINAGGDGGCEKQDKFVPSQEKVHQKKCLEGDKTWHTWHLLRRSGQNKVPNFHSLKPGWTPDGYRFEGDMMLSKEQLEWFEAGLLECELDGVTANRRKREALTNPNRLWPDNVVYYSFDETVDNSRKNEVRSILSVLQVELSSCLEFKERNEGNRIIVGSSKAGCWSEVGYKTEGPQKLNLDNKFCWEKRIIEHEFLHAIGIFHTQSRSDRDDYVNVEEGNIQEGKDRNFNKYDQIRMPHYDLMYDYSSLMHYPPDAFGIPDFEGKYPRITLDPKEPSKLYVIGQQPSVSSGDVQQVQRLYQCHSAGSGELRSPDESTGKSASSTFQPTGKSPRPTSQSTEQDEEIPVLDFFSGSRFVPTRGRGR